MAYDRELADEVRALVGGGPEVREQPMFGGLSFLVGGNLAIAVSGRGGILVRVGPDDAERRVAAAEADPAVMGGRTMRGWVHVTAERVRGDGVLASWVRRGVAYAGSLPDKRR